MKKPSSKIRQEIAKLQDQLKVAETREAERIGRIALKAGIGDIEIDETHLQEAFEELRRRFRAGKPITSGRKGEGTDCEGSEYPEAVTPGASTGSTDEV
ncbi:conjugal transfer protein TraC [Agrobacterium sp.]|uniref:conjugal transfer protein TraC n=1 Tax=Agrobacterium sp. TaxID=361 RepID=UPI0028A7EAED